MTLVIVLLVLAAIVAMAGLIAAFASAARDQIPRPRRPTTTKVARAADGSRYYGAPPYVASRDRGYDSTGSNTVAVLSPVWLPPPSWTSTDSAVSTVTDLCCSSDSYCAASDSSVYTGCGE